MKKNLIFSTCIIAILIILSGCDTGGSDNDGLVNGKNVNLVSLTLTDCAISFKPEIAAYSAEVAANIASTTITASAADNTAIIYINGMATSSLTVDLDYGKNNIGILVVSADSTAERLYGIAINRLDTISHNADLSGLDLSADGFQPVLSPAFEANTTLYTAEAPNNITSINITPLATGANSTIKINGNSAQSGSAFNIGLNAGMNPVSIVVTSEDGTTVKTYHLVIDRTALSSNANLASLTISAGSGISPVFNKNTITYTVEVPYKTASITVTATAAGINASIDINGEAVISGSASSPVYLSPGSNLILIFITAEDGTTKLYTLTVNRIAASTNANLSGLSISAGDILTPAFDPDVINYTAVVPHSTSSVTVTPTAAGLNATIKVNGIAVTSGTASGAIDLADGRNAISVAVTAESGDTKTYTVIVHRYDEAQGILDETFGTGGLATTIIDSIFDMVFQSDGKVIVAGDGLARYNTDGTVDATFGTDGKVSTDIGIIESIALQNDGKILACGSASNHYILARYNADGILDNSFGTNGKVITIIDIQFASGGSITLKWLYDSGIKILIQTDGKIIATGFSADFGTRTTTLARYNPDGSIDTSFGTNGIVKNHITDVDYVFSAAIQSDGKIVVGVIDGSYNSYILTRFQINGAIDSSFGSNGIVNTTIGSGQYCGIYSIAIQADNKIISAGVSYNGSDSLHTLARYDIYGNLDSSFGTNGITTTKIGSGSGNYPYNAFNSIGIQCNGKIVALGRGLARYDSNGMLDTTFGTNGIVTISSEAGYAVIIQPDGKIVAAGGNQLARYR